MRIKKKITAFSKLLAVNFFVLIILFVFAEIILGNWFSLETTKETCFNEQTHHDYCPSISIVKTNSFADGGNSIPIYVNASSIRVANSKEILNVTDVSKYDIINIGDSFMQADEVEFNQLLSQVMARLTGKNVLQVGYSSWAPLNMYNWLLGKKLKKGTHVNLFLMMNDFTPHYWASNYSYFTTYSIRKGEERVFILPKQKTETWLERFYKRSFFYNRFTKLLQSLHKRKHGNVTQISVKLFNIQNRPDLLKEIRKRFSVPILALDYLYFAFGADHWSDEIRLSVDNALEYTNKIVKFIRNRNGTIAVYLIPGGWSFLGECILGKQMPDYNFAPDAIVTSLGLAEYIKKRIEGTFMALEPVIKNLKTGDSEKWYFPQDGHWTPHAHSKLGQWFANAYLEQKAVK